MGEGGRQVSFKQKSVAREENKLITNEQVVLLIGVMRTKC
jgi:hypothetical protein